MFSFIARHKTGLTFILIILFLFSSIAGQVPAPEHPSLLAWVIYTVVSPFQHAASYLVVGVSSVWEEYIDLRGVREENEILRQEVHQYSDNDE